MIRLAVEMPNSYLKHHGDLFHYEFCLTHMAEQSEEYLNFYLEQNKKGRITILDNSVFELGEAVDTARVLAIYNKFENKENVVVVAPDAFGDANKTKEQFDAFLLQLKTTLKEKIPKIMAVAQGKDFNTWLDCYAYFANQPEVAILGVPYGLKFDIPGYTLPGPDRPKTQNQMWRRIYLFKKLQDLDVLDYKWHHLLGTSNPFELYYQSAVPEIRSADTSTPYNEAVLGHPVLSETELSNREKEKRPDNYFDLEYNEEHAKIAAQNVLNMKLWASGRKRELGD